MGGAFEGLGIEPDGPGVEPLDFSDGTREHGEAPLVDPDAGLGDDPELMGGEVDLDRGPGANTDLAEDLAALGLGELVDGLTPRLDGFGAGFAQPSGLFEGSLPGEDAERDGTVGDGGGTGAEGGGVVAGLRRCLAGGHGAQ